MLVIWCHPGETMIVEARRLALPRQPAAPDLPLLRSCEIQPFVGWLESQGVPVEGLLRRAALPSEPMERPHALVAEVPVWAFAEGAAQSQGIPDLGWRVGAATSGDAVDAFGRVLPGARSLRAGIVAFCREETWNASAADFGLYQTRGAAWFYRNPTPGIEVGADRIEQYVAMMLVQMVRVAAGPTWNPTRLKLRMRRLDPIARELLGDPEVELGAPITAVHLRPELLSRPLRTTSRSVSLLQPRRGLDPAGDLVGALRQAVAAALPGLPGVDWAAQAAGTSRRTLQRRLADHGFTWDGLVDLVRQEVALRELCGEELPIREVARRAGYSNPANFTRAFRRWNGVAPSAFRRGVARGERLQPTDL